MPVIKKPNLERPVGEYDLGEMRLWGGMGSSLSAEVTLTLGPRKWRIKIRTIEEFEGRRSSSTVRYSSDTFDELPVDETYNNMSVADLFARVGGWAPDLLPYIEAERALAALAEGDDE
jgi:hypothetical protein